MKEKFAVSGMTCSACSAHIEKSVNKLDGIDSVNVNLLANNMTVSFDDKKCSVQDIISAVESGGYGASLYGEKSKKSSQSSAQETIDSEISNMKKRLIISIIFTLPLFYISMGHMMGSYLPDFFHSEANAITFSFTQFLLCLPVVAVNFKFFRNGFKSLFNGSPNMDTLIAIGSSAAMLYGIYAIYKIGYGMGHNDIQMVSHFSMDLYFESSSMILTLITLGKMLETRAKGKTSEAITKLINLRPTTATVIRNGIEEEIEISDVACGDTVVIKSGQTIPVDGIISEGSASIDEAAITGESLPVEKQVGDKVIGATINKSGYIQFYATKVGDDTTLSQIIRLMEEASSSKAPIAKLADKISGVFVPIVISIAVLSAIVWLLLGKDAEFALSVGISVLVISCPCALGLATPTAIMVGTGRGAQNGILIKSADALESSHKIDTVVLDKTGTITQGKPSVTDIIPIGDVTEENLIMVAASMENYSEHPLAKAVSEHYKGKLLDISNFKTLAGLGISGMIGKENVLAGNLKLMLENGVNCTCVEDSGKNLAKQGKTPLYFAVSGKIIGIVAVADTIKPTSKQAVAQLQSMGIDVIMLTGDNEATAEAIAKQVGIKSAVAQVMPQDKETQVRKLQSEGKKVAMVGDGINDAPALTRADVGVAIGAGTDIAIESADVVLVRNDLRDVPTLIQLSGSTIKNIKQNLFWALIYNTIGIPLAAGILFIPFGIKLNPMFAAAAMSLSSVSVVSNALRLRFFKPKEYTANNPVAEDEINITINEKREVSKMKKVMNIEGMMCAHCSGRVEKVLSEINGVESVEVNLEAKNAVVTLSEEISDEVLSSAVTDAGYEVKSIE